MSSNLAAQPPFPATELVMRGGMFRCRRALGDGAAGQLASGAMQAVVEALERPHRIEHPPFLQLSVRGRAQYAGQMLEKVVDLGFEAVDRGQKPLGLLAVEVAALRSQACRVELPRSDPSVDGKNQIACRPRPDDILAHRALATLLQLTYPATLDNSTLMRLGSARTNMS